MYIVLIILLLIFFLCALLLLIYWTCCIYQGIYSDAPYVSSPTHSLAAIDTLLDLTDARNAIVYDIGCGDAKVLVYLAKKYPQHRFIGIEKFLLPYFIGLLRVKTSHVSNITLIRQDFKNISFSEATHIYLYLFPSILRSLEPLIIETTAAKKVVTVDFTFPNLSPTRVVQLQETSPLGKKAYLYMVNPATKKSYRS